VRLSPREVLRRGIGLAPGPRRDQKGIGGRNGGIINGLRVQRGTWRIVIKEGALRGKDIFLFGERVRGLSGSKMIDSGPWL